MSSTKGELTFYSRWSSLDSPVEPTRPLSIQQAAARVRDILLRNIAKRQHHTYHSHHGPLTYVSAKDYGHPSRRPR